MHQRLPYYVAHSSSLGNTEAMRVAGDGCAYTQTGIAQLAVPPARVMFLPVRAWVACRTRTALTHGHRQRRIRHTDGAARCVTDHSGPSRRLA